MSDTEKGKLPQFLTPAERLMELASSHPQITIEQLWDQLDISKRKWYELKESENLRLSRDQIDQACSALEITPAYLFEPMRYPAAVRDGEISWTHARRYTLPNSPHQRHTSHAWYRLDMNQADPATMDPLQSTVALYRTGDPPRTETALCQLFWAKEWQEWQVKKIAPAPGRMHLQAADLVGAYPVFAIEIENMNGS